MPQSIKNAKDALDALNDNFQTMVSGERKISTGKEINNTIGKMTAIVKLRLNEKQRIGDNTPLDWLKD